MKRFLAALVVLTLVSSTGCATLGRIIHSPAAIQLILSDAQWGVSQAHDELWLSDAEYTIFETALATAQDAIRVAPSGARAIVKQILIDAEAALPPTSHLRPYFDAALILL